MRYHHRVAFATATSVVSLCAGAAQAAAAAEAQSTQVAAPAQGAADPALAAPLPDEGSEIVVTGIRGSIASAIAQKRASDVIIDGISAADIGNIPDLDLGEALVRIPGVQIDRDAERRGSSISVRGLPASFTKTTVMGQNIASPSAARFRVNPFGAFDSSIFSGANVIKSFTPDIQSGGLGANVDLTILPALARKDGQVVLRAELGYEELPEAANPGYFGAVSKHVTDNFGVYGTVAYTTQRFRRDIVTINAYRNLVPDPTAANPTGRFNSTDAALQAKIRALDPDLNTASDYSVLVPSQMRQFTEQSSGYRLSGVTGFEWRPIDGLSVRTDAIFTRRELDDNLLDSLEVNLTNANSVTTPVGEAISAGSFNSISELQNGVDTGDLERLFYFPNISFSNPNYIPGNRSFNFLEQTYGIYPQIQYKDDNWTVGVIGTYSEARNQFVQEQFQVSAAALAGAGNGITGSYGTGNGDIGDYSFNVNLPANAFVFAGFPTGALTGNGRNANFNGNRNTFSLAANNQRVERSLYAGQIDVERRLDFGPLTAIKIGGRYQRDDTLTLRQDNSLFGTRLENLNSGIFKLNSSATSGQDFFNGTAPNALFDNFLSLDLDRVRAALLPIDPARLPAGASKNFLSDFYQTLPLTGTAAFNWDTKRDNIEAYAMARFSLADLTGINARGNFGVRYTRTKLNGNLIAIVADNGTVASAATPPVDRTYESWLPSANLIVDLTDELVFNAAYYHTYEAIDLSEFSPAPNSYSAIDAPGDTTLAPEILDVNFSSLDREPRTSKAVDLGLIWYNRTGSLIGINLFHKRISSQYEEQAVCPAGGVDLFLPTRISTGALVLDGSNICRTTAALTVARGTGTQTLAAGSEVQAGQLVASSTPLKLRGIEAQIQQDLSFLDGWVSGFGAQANISYVDASRKVFGVSDYTYNLIGYYEVPEFAVRLARNTRAGNLLPSGGGFQGGERAVRGRSQLDASVRITPQPGFDIRLEAFNLTNVLRQEYEFVPGLARRTDYDGRTYNLSLQVAF